MKVFTTLEEVAKAAGTEIGTSAWVEITQESVNQFADATNDHQWIHVDVERAASGPFGGTIAHGYMTLALIPGLSNNVMAFETPGAKLNYGINKARFPMPVPVGSRVRAKVGIVEAAPLPQGLQVTLSYVIEVEDAPKPACVAETVVLLLDS